MSIVLNRTRETISAGGTGALTLSGAVLGHQTVNAAIGTYRRFYYFIEDDAAWESGIGYETTSTNLVREQFIESSTGSLLNVSTNAEVFSEAPGHWNGLSYPKTRSGKEVLPNNFTKTNSVTVIADRLYYYRVKFETFLDIATFQAKVSTAVGTKARVGLYDVDPTTGLPIRLIAESGDLSTTSTGSKTAAISGSCKLYPGWYYAAFVCDGAAGFIAWDRIYGTAGGPIGGATALAPVPAIYEVLSSWSALPTTPSGSLNETTTHLPAFGLF